MATGKMRQRLAPYQIKWIASEVSLQSLKDVALEFMDFNEKEINTVFSSCGIRDDDTLKSALLQEWARRNSDSRQVLKLAIILYKSVRKGFLDKVNIEEILGMTEYEILDAILTETKFNEVAEKLPTHTAQTTRIEMAPWAKAYTVDIKDIHTELKLKKIADRTASETMHDYRELFRGRKELSGESKLSPPRTVLIKGNEGFGKTTISKKIMFDWSERTFTKFDVVFRVSLKDVQLGDTIEKVVLEQNPTLKDLDILPEQLKALFDYFGKKCLIILDGSCEEPSIINQMMESIGDRCNVVVTALPCVIDQLQVQFDIEAELQGLSSDSAEHYVPQVLKERSFLDSLLQFNANNYLFGRDFSSPMLLLFISILADNGELDLTERDVAVGEIYFKLVRFLFKKSLLKKGGTFLEEIFNNLLMEIGEIAWNCMTEGGPLMMQAFRRFEINPLDVGILTVREASSGLSDHNAGIFVSFNHSTLQYFFGSVFFVKDIDALNMSFDTKGSLFFDFCLWASGSQTSPLAHEIRRKAYDIMASFVAEKIDTETFDWSVTFKRYTVLQFCILGRIKQYREFVQRSVSLCKKVKHIILDKITNVEIVDLLEMLETLWQTASTVQILRGEIEIEQSIFDYIKSMASSENLVLITDALTSEIRNSLVEHCRNRCRKCNYYLLPKQFDPLDLSKLFMCNLEEIHVNALVLGSEHFTLGSSDTFEAPDLKRLSLCNLTIDDTVLASISKAMLEGKFPKLADFSLAGSNLGGGRFKLLVQSAWPSLVHLDLNECPLKGKDMALLQVTFQENLFPKLMSLNIWGDAAELLSAIPSGLNKLSLRSMTHVGSDSFLLTEGGMMNQQNLLILDFSNSSGMSGKLKDLFKSNSFPLLETLVLRNCELSPYDMISLTQARMENRIPNIKHLDISQNYTGPDALRNFSSHFDRWESLHNLNIISLQQRLAAREPLRMVMEGCFASLERLHISIRSKDKLNEITAITFPFLKELYIHDYYDEASVLGEIVQVMKSEGIFPSLTTCIVCTGNVSCDHQTIHRRINSVEEDMAIEVCPGNSIPTMMHLRRRRDCQEEEHALTRPSEAIETSKLTKIETASTDKRTASTNPVTVEENVSVSSLRSLVKGVLKQRVQIVEIVHGSAVTIQALHSDVILHVPDGVYGIILGNIHTDHWRFRHLIGENDCIISPICEYFFKKFSGSEQNAVFRVQVPHIVQNIKENVQVKFQSRRNGPLFLAHRLQEREMQHSADVSYKLHKTYLEIFSPHFSRFFITAKGIKCCCHSAGLLIFSKMVQQPNPLANVRVYFTSLHYNMNDYLKTLRNDEKVNGRRLVQKDQLFLSNQTYDVSRSFVEISFHTDDEYGTKQWRSYRDSKLYKKWELDRVLNYSGQHLCKSIPLGLPPVYLVPLNPESEHHLEMSVNAQVALGSRRSKNKKPLEAEPLRMVFDPSGKLAEVEDGMANLSLTAASGIPYPGRELTDAMLLNLSGRISSPGQLRTLAIKGLNLKDYVLQKHLQNEKDINEAAIKVLKEWKWGQENSTVAYSRLCDILRKVKMSSFICEALEDNAL